MTTLNDYPTHFGAKLFCQSDMPISTITMSLASRGKL